MSLRRLLTLLLLGLTPVMGGGSVRANEIVTLNLNTNDLVYDPHSRLLYASVPTDPSLPFHSIAAIDPATGKVVRSQVVGSNPDKLALSGDG